MQALGGFLLALLTVLVLADASSLYQRHTALMAVADDAALAAAGAVDVAALYRDGIGDALPIDPALARALAERSVQQASDDRLRDLRLEAVTVGADAVEVVVTASVPAPLSGIAGDRSLRLRARAISVSRTRW